MIEMLQAYIEKYEADAARLASRTQNTRFMFFELLVIVTSQLGKVISRPPLRFARLKTLITLQPTRITLNQLMCLMREFRRLKRRRIM